MEAKTYSPKIARNLDMPVILMSFILNGLLNFFFNNFQVKLLGEGADDAGGVFDDVITEMCRELVSTSSNLVIK